MGKENRRRDSGEGVAVLAVPVDCVSDAQERHPEPEGLAAGYHREHRRIKVSEIYCVSPNAFCMVG